MTTQIDETIQCEWCGRFTDLEEWNNSREGQDVSYMFANYDHYGDTQPLCIDCYNSRTDCGECGYQVYEYDGHYCDRHGESFCEGCYDDSHYSCEYSNESLHDYGYRPTPLFKRTQAQTEAYSRTGDIPLYMGIELETEGSLEIDNLADFIEADGENHFYLKEDSSVSGPEMVSHPMTLDYWEEWSDSLKELLNSAKNDSLHTGNSAGYHVHINRDGLGNTRGRQAQVETNVLAVLEVHWDKFIQLARRSESHWARKNTTGTTDLGCGCSDHLCAGTLETAKMRQGRYSALNFSNPYTLEFRLWRSTLNRKNVLATLQAIHLMVAVAKHWSLTQILDSKWSDLMTLSIGMPEWWGTTSDMSQFREFFDPDLA